MKIAYLGKIQLSDVDLSYLHEAQKLSDITYIVEINPRFMRGPAFNLTALHTKSGLFKATDAYPELSKLGEFIDLEKFYVLNATGRFWLLKSLWTNILLLFFLLRNNFDVIHLSWPPNVYEFVLYLLRKKMFLTVHDPFVHTAHDSFVVRLRRKVAFSLIHHLIILNKAQRKDFGNYYKVSDDRIIESRLSSYTYLNIVEPDFSSIPDEGTFILFAGRISPYKGIDTLLQAMDIVHGVSPDCKLVLAGGGCFHFDVSPYQSKDYINIINRFIPDSELVALIQRCKFMVCPYTDATQSGVIMSSFAFHKPVIVSDVGGLPEMTGNGRYGSIVERCNIETLAQAIISLWKDKEKLHGYSNNIYKDYTVGDLSWYNVAANLREHYKKCLHPQL